MSNQQKYKLTIAYDGRDFSGWQVQPNAESIQQNIEEAIKTITREDVKVIGSGRTDAGVHATGQIAHFTLRKSFDCHKLMYSLNGILPKTIRILECKKASSDFHARYSAKSKVYRYNLCLSAVQPPFSRHTSWHLRQTIDPAFIGELTHYFVGNKNFASFANEQHKGASAISSIRNLYRIDILPWEHGITLEFEANGFLYKMVRNIVGTLIACAKGKIKKEEIDLIFLSKDRKRAGHTAPAHGLTLHLVNY